MSTGRLPILMHGGGIDSTAVFLLLVTARVQFEVVHADYGQASRRQEWRAIRSQCRRYDVRCREVKFPPLIRGRDMYKGRNAFLLTYAFTQTNRVYAAMTSDCAFPDSKPAFIEALLSAVREVNPSAELILPFFDYEKQDEYRFISLVDPDVPFWTCSDSRTSKPCGRCDHCVDLRRAKLEMKTGKRVPIPRGRLSPDRIERDELL